MAETCPISVSQLKTLHGFGHLTLHTGIPPAVDLPSLINTVNAIREALRSLTSSRTVNNTSIRNSATIGAPASTNYLGSTLYISPYPEWGQANVETVTGYMFHKDKSNKITGFDKTQRAYVMRQNAVEYNNFNKTVGLLEKPFIWRYVKKLDSLTGI